ncbi:MAG: DUF3883 domain-containing protein [Planctomycetaceae bacterium]|nr:DUF3883 domain-containing protein [Planctomycetaceae bacterium]
MTIADPFAVPMIFFRITWMSRYQGVTNTDKPVGGGSYVTTHGFGHEIFNFQPFQGSVFGFGTPAGQGADDPLRKLHLLRIGGRASDKSKSGVLVVWVATAPMGGLYIVGWYRDATVFREWQPPPVGAVRRHQDTDCGYFVTAQSENAVLLPPDERNFSIPQMRQGGFGRASVWYAANRKDNAQIRENVLAYVASRRLPTTAGPARPANQPDPLLRQRVETIAVETTIKHFDGLGYDVRSVERDNIGWDLNASLSKRHLRLEVKGLSGSQIVVELTPNEYRAMKEHQSSYRVCVVSNALVSPCLDVFAHSHDSGKWENANGMVLNLEEIIAVRCSAGRSGFTMAC